MRNKIMLVTATAMLLSIAGCSSKETPVATGTSNPSTTAKAGGGGSTTAGGAVSTEAPGTTKPAGCTTALKIVNAKSAAVAGLTDGPVEFVTLWSDEGPHPDNTVDYDQSLSAALAQFEIPSDKQFGYGIPVGTPTVPAGKVYLSFSLRLKEGKIAAGKTFVGSTSTEKADGTINFSAMYFGAQRLLPGELAITITELTDEMVCGKITSTTKTDLQSFVGIEGTFKLKRIQALEAAEAK